MEIEPRLASCLIRDEHPSKAVHLPLMIGDLIKGDRTSDLCYARVRHKDIYFASHVFPLPSPQTWLRHTSCY